MPNVTRALWAAAGLVAMLVFATGLRAGEKEWTWRDREGKTRSLQDLKSILASHKTWIESDGKLGSQANFNGADLHGADLRGVELSGAQLATNLVKADLDGADLRGAFLRQADLSGSQIAYANCQGANLDLAKLVDARLYGSRFDGASFRGADLRGAILVDHRRAPPTGLTAVVVYNVPELRLPVPKVTIPSSGSGSITPPPIPQTPGRGASLEFANLSNADLTGADLGNSLLSSADLAGAKLTGALVGGADLTYTVFEPFLCRKPVALPLPEVSN